MIRFDPRKLYVLLTVTVTLIASFYGLLFHPALFEPLWGIPLVGIFLVMISKVLVQVSNGLRLQYLVRVFGFQIGCRESIGLSSQTSVLNTLLPAKLGVVSRAYYLKSNLGMKYLDYLKLTLFGNFVYLVISFVVVGAGLTVYGELFQELFQNKYLVWGGSVFVVFCTLLFVSKLKKLCKYFSSVDNGSSTGQQESLRKGLLPVIDVNKFIPYLGVELIFLVIKAVALVACLFAVSSEVNLVLAVFLMALVSIATIVNITPGNIGVTEALLVYLLMAIGVSTELAVSVALLSRVSSIATQFLVANVFSAYLIPVREGAN